MKNVELTHGILKSVDSAMHVISDYSPMFMLKYKGKLVQSGGKGVRLFASKSAAKSAVTNIVKQMFRHGEYWQSCAKQVKARTGYELDFSETIKILSSYGETSKFDDPANKKMFKDIAEKLIADNIFTIEELQ